MKIRNLFSSVAAVAVAVVSCGEVSDVTEISGVVVPEGVSEVNVVVGETIDTLVPVLDGKFVVSVPADVCQVGTIAAGQYGINFVSDGTPLEVVIDAESVIEPKYPKISVQARMNEFFDAEEAFIQEYRTRQSEILADTLSSDEEKRSNLEAFYESFFGPYREHNLRTFTQNSDNVVSVFALRNLIGEFDDVQMDSLLNTLAPALMENRYVKSMKDAISARVSTAEGCMFKDFSVNSVVGQTRSIPPQPVYGEVKLSDYVGKGKYVLLDFWAPWCGPCKREMPNIKEVYRKYAGKKFEVVSIAVWERDPVDVTISTAAELGMVWPQINNAGSEPASLYGVEAIPHLILFGPDGTILRRGFHGAEIEEVVASYLK